jgi:hypothetical protein
MTEERKTRDLWKRIEKMLIEGSSNKSLSEEQVYTAIRYANNLDSYKGVSSTTVDYSILQSTFPRDPIKKFEFFEDEDECSKRLEERYAHIERVHTALNHIFDFVCITKELQRSPFETTPFSVRLAYEVSYKDHAPSKRWEE